MQSLTQSRAVEPAQQLAVDAKKQRLGSQQGPRHPRVVPCARPPQRQFRTIRENIDRKRLQKLAETNPDAVKLDPKPMAGSTDSKDGPPVALLAGGAALLLLVGALLASQSPP